jgi:transcription antitermination factor NusG
MESCWAVLRTQPHCEPLVARAVHARGVDSYLPGLPIHRPSRPIAPLFPGYLFAHIAPNSDDLLRIRSAPGVAYVLPRAGPPTLLPNLLIEAIRSREMELRSSAAGEAFSRGERVMVMSGPFKSVEGIFDRRLSTAGRVRILLQMAQASVALQTETGNLKRLKA